MGGLSVGLGGGLSPLPKKIINSARLTGYSSTKKILNLIHEYCRKFVLPVLLSLEYSTKYEYALYYTCSYAHQTLIVIH